MRVATVLSAREWESDLVSEARRSATVRLVLRAYRPEDIDERVHELDAVVAGAETSWVTPAVIAAWKRRGLGVLGMCPPADAPARRLLVQGGADAVLDDDAGPSRIIHTVLTLEPGSTPPDTQLGSVIAVAGPRGAPGRTEIAFGLAWLWSRHRHTVALDLDHEAPALALRAGVPTSHENSAIDPQGQLNPQAVHEVGALHLVTATRRTNTASHDDGWDYAVVGAAVGAYDIVVVDSGPTETSLCGTAGKTVLVVEATPLGIVRAAEMLRRWDAEPPAVVLNRVGADAREANAALRQWTGNDAAAQIPRRHAIRRATAISSPPHRVLVRSLRPLVPR